MPTETITTPGTGTWTVPEGVTSIEVWGWGAGAGNGGGGAFSAQTITVTPGDVINYTIGAGGAGAGGDTSARVGTGADFLLAKGGSVAGTDTPGAGGQASAGIGTTKYSGGSGGNVTAASTGPAALFASGQQGLVFLPGTQYTDCYVETTGTPPATLCTHNTSIGTIHDKVRNVYTRIPTLSNRPLYTIANGKHAAVFNGSTNRMPVTGDTQITTNRIDAVFGVDILGEGTGILLSVTDPNDNNKALADYQGVYDTGQSSTNLGSLADMTANPSIRIDGASANITTRGQLQTALAVLGGVVVTLQVTASYGSLNWHTGTYGNGATYGYFSHTATIYGLIIRFSDDFTTDELQLAETLAEAQMP